MANRINRRDFLRTGAAGVAALGSLPAMAASAANAGIAGVRLAEEDGRLRFGNAHVELLIDRTSGYFVDIRNVRNGLSYKRAGTGSWPFALSLGHDWCPDLLEVTMPGEGPCAQTMRYELVQDSDGASTLQMMWPDLVTTAGNPTGVSLTARVTLRDGDEHFRIRSRVVNGSRYSITRLACGGGDLVAADTREAETLAVPTWSHGQVWPNPHGHFARRATFGYPVFGTHCGLDCGWLDLHGPTGGIGVGYLNRQGITMLFNVEQ